MNANILNFDSFVEEVIRLSNEKLIQAPPLLHITKSFSKNKGLYLEFGVHKGGTINQTANILPDWNLYGFDSFEGLPEQWRIGFPKGAFNLNGSLPSVHKSVTLVKGWFDETIPLWMNSNKSYSYIDILHIDCDLYSSTKTIFDNLHSMINQKTIIVFDELINYPTFKNHEIKALYEYLQKHNLDIDILCSKGENVALKIK